MVSGCDHLERENFLYTPWKTSVELSKGYRITKFGVVQYFLGGTITQIRNQYNIVKVVSQQKLGAGLLYLERSLDQDR